MHTYWAKSQTRSHEAVCINVSEEQDLIDVAFGHSWRQLVIFCSFLIFTLKLHLILNYIICLVIDTTQTYTYTKLKKPTVKNLLPSTISSAFIFRLFATNVMSFLFSSKNEYFMNKKTKT